jgi:hypothetical protein
MISTRCGGALGSLPKLNTHLISSHLSLKRSRIIWSPRGLELFPEEVDTPKPEELLTERYVGKYVKRDANHGGTLFKKAYKIPSFYGNSLRGAGAKGTVVKR